MGSGLGGSARAATSPPKREEVVAADLAGDLDLAVDLARATIHAGDSAEDLAVRVRTLLLLARTLRHREDHSSLADARSLTRTVLALARLTESGGGTLTAAAELELAACLAAAGLYRQAHEAAKVLRHHPNHRLAGWAWSTMGQANLGARRPAAAVSAISNALAEFARADPGQRILGTRTRLGAALLATGDVAQAADLLTGDLPSWREPGASRRLRIQHHLTTAAALRGTGEIGGAVRLLRQVDALLAGRTGMDFTRVRFHHEYATCLRIWGQLADAQHQFDLGEQVRAGLAGVPRPGLRHDRSPVPDTPLPVASVIAPQDPLEELQASADELSVAVESDVTSRGVRLATGRWRRDLGSVRFALLMVQDTEGADAIVERVERLEGMPDGERAEAMLLVEAGEGLARPDSLHPLQAERLLRRALVRLERLTGLELWRARAELALAKVLRSDNREEALRHALAAVQRLDEERFRMRHRDLRGNWLAEVFHPASHLAIELALECGRTEVAADLVIFSRVAGVVAPGDLAARQGELPLTAVPRLYYTDGNRSDLGSGGSCLFL
ncbi:hypothetical protein FOJ82_13440 [Tessaracoccus rhinocerotis]|uniref:Tetratricopeptide repeat protein n=1 Tax=Tessaracoccus rhinocerotis TaxID=1689449 RepID=A0A553JWM1_9ACTN|nr:hypothetical protein [Tessaracoccus rhinocerotis]TRY16871.1 hypothetical protein FOJ82_13440 [Tessaracoccus rhinocerotis]